MEESASRVTDEEPAPPELTAARAAFDRGDFMETRRLAAEVAERTDLPADTRAQARELLAALGSDRLAVALGVGCLLFFLVTVWFTLVH